MTRYSPFNQKGTGTVEEKYASLMRTRTKPWPPGEGKERKPYAEGWHAALFEHPASVCRYDGEDMMEWMRGYNARMARSLREMGGVHR